MDILCKRISSADGYPLHRCYLSTDDTHLQMIPIFRWCPSADDIHLQTISIFRSAICPQKSVTFSFSKNRAVGGGGSSASWNFSESSSILVSTGFRTIINFLTVLLRCDICPTYINHFLLIVKSLLVCSNPSVSDSIEGRSVFSSHLHHSPTSTHHQPAQHLRPKWVICGLAAWDLINLMPRLPP